MMEESSRFLTLSGLSGILVGVIALIGAYLVGRMIYSESAAVILLYGSVSPAAIIIAAVVLILSLLTIVLFTSYRVKKSGKRFWNAGTRMMLVNLAIPLVTGGLLILILLFNGIYEIIIPGTLIFYGLALINAVKIYPSGDILSGIVPEYPWNCCSSSACSWIRLFGLSVLAFCTLFTAR